MNARILIADDDPDLLRLMSVTLEQAGHTTRTATNGREALDAARADPPDLLITDVTMPEMNGWELVRKLRAYPETSLVPVVFLTVLGDKDSRLRGFQLGADDYFAKPFTTLELVVRANAVLQKAMSHRSLFDGPSSAGDLEGNLGIIGAPSVLTMLELDQKSGLLKFQCPDGECHVALQGGRVLRAALPGQPDVSTDECIYRLVTCAEGTFSFTKREMSGDPETAHTITSLLLEGAKRLDEDSR